MKKTKQPIFRYGIEIKKPWSVEMYEHNEIVEQIAKKNIKKALIDAYNKIEQSGNDPDVIDEFRELGTNVTAYGFVDGYPDIEVLEQTLTELEYLPKHYLNGAYHCFVHDGVLEKLEPGFIGFETRKELEYLANHQDEANSISYLKKVKKASK